MAGGRPDGALARHRSPEPVPAGSRRGARPRRRAAGVRGRRARLVLMLATVIGLVVGGWLWLRDSSLVAVEHVTVTGQSGTDATQIRSALVAEARNMTTLDVRVGELRMAVAPYAVVKDLRVSTQFPHGMRIRVIEQVPVAVVVAPGRKIAVAGDGTLLRDVLASSALPTIPLRIAPGGTHLTGYLLSEVAVVRAAPDELLSQISQVSAIAPHGLVAQLRNGPSIYFGDANHLAAKWSAAVAVLADAGSAEAVYIDVTDPQRPAAGAGSDSNASTAVSGGSGTAATGSSTASTGSSTAATADAADSGGSVSSSTGG
jgi:cell division protein FtsQ